MRVRQLFGPIALLLMVTACSEPQVQTPISAIAPEAYVDTTNVETIDLPDVQNTSSDIEVSITGSNVVINDSTMRLDANYKDIKRLELILTGKGTVESILVNGHVEFSNNEERTITSEKENNERVPFRIVGENKIKVLTGATLELVTRYYDTSIEELQKCNNIPNPDYIPAGSILTLRCICKPCK